MNLDHAPVESTRCVDGFETVIRCRLAQKYLKISLHMLK